MAILKGKYFSIIDKIINVSRQINSLESIVAIDYIKDFEISDNRLQRYSDLMNKTTSTIYVTMYLILTILCILCIHLELLANLKVLSILLRYASSTH